MVAAFSTYPVARPAKKYVCRLHRRRTPYGAAGVPPDPTDFASPKFAGIAVTTGTPYDHPDLPSGWPGTVRCATGRHPDPARPTPDHRGGPGSYRPGRGPRPPPATRATSGPARIADPLVTEFRQAVRFGLSQIRRTPGPAATTKQPVGRLLLECLRDRENDVLRFVTDTRVWPTNNQSDATSPCAQQHLR